jgi:hypothetical protein
MPKLAGIGVLFFLAFILLGGCGDGSNSSKYSNSTNVTNNGDGSSTYHSTDSRGRDFTCTFNNDGSSNCSGSP